MSKCARKSFLHWWCDLPLGQITIEIGSVEKHGTHVDRLPAIRPTCSNHRRSQWHNHYPWREGCPRKQNYHYHFRWATLIIIDSYQIVENVIAASLYACTRCSIYSVHSAEHITCENPSRVTRSQQNTLNQIQWYSWTLILSNPHNSAVTQPTFASLNNAYPSGSEYFWKHSLLM